MEKPVNSMNWRAFGRMYAGRFLIHLLGVSVVWVLLLAYEHLKRSGLPVQHPTLAMFIDFDWQGFVRDSQPAFLPGLMTLLCVAWAWTSIAFAAPAAVSLALCISSTSIGALFARFPIPERASSWLIALGPETPRLLQLSFLTIAAVFSLTFLMMKMTKQYERLNQDRLALSPNDEDLMIRSLVQSIVSLVIVCVGAVSLWNISNVRLMPAIARAELRDGRPAVLVLAVDTSIHARLLKTRIGEPFFKSWVIFGSPETSSKFDEILQCRYPIRLSRQSGAHKRQVSREVNDFLVPAALGADGYSIHLLHAGSVRESSEALKILSRNYAHVRFFRRFGLLLPSRVFYTPDVQLSQMREALSVSVGSGKPAFLTASLLSREGRVATDADIEQFDTFLDALREQNWTKNIVIALLEFPTGLQDRKSMDLSVGATSAHVSFWATGALADSALISSSAKLVRGIDVGASLAARLRLSSVVSLCDGAALFDVAERPSVFPRDLVYQELNLSPRDEVFRKRGWLSSDGYRLELNETHAGAMATTFKYSLKMGSYNRSWEPVDERVVDDEGIRIELNRQLDDFLRTTGVEILPLGNGRNAYSEPFKRIRLLQY